jgi:hypothetical protein
MDMKEYNKTYYQKNKEHILFMDAWRKREIITDYTHDCGKSFHSAAEAFVHLATEKCEPLLYTIFDDAK